MTIKDLRERLQKQVATIKAERDAMQAEVHNSAMSEKTKFKVLRLLDMSAKSKIDPIYDTLSMLSEEMFALASEQAQAMKAAGAAK